MMKLTKVALAATTSLSMICTIGMSVYAQTEIENVDTVDVSENMDESVVEDVENLDKTPTENIKEDVEEETTEEQPIVSEDATNSEVVSDEEVKDLGTFHFTYIDILTGKIIKTYTFKPSQLSILGDILYREVPQGYALCPSGGLGWASNGPGDYYYNYYIQPGTFNPNDPNGVETRLINIKYIEEETGKVILEEQGDWPSGLEHLTPFMGMLWKIENLGYYTNEKVWNIENGQVTILVHKRTEAMENGHLFNITLLSDKQAFDKDNLVFEQLDTNSDNKIDYKEIQSLLPKGYKLDSRYKDDDVFFELVTDDTGYTSVRPVGNAFGSVFITEIKVEDPSDTDSSDDQTDTSNPDESKEDNNHVSQDDNTKKETSVKEVSSQQKEKSTKTAYGTNPIIWTELMSLALALGIGMIARYKSKSNS